MGPARKFFIGRNEVETNLDLGDFGGGASLAKYPNVPPAIGAVISAGKATLHELSTVYGTEDLYLMLEIIVVDAINRRLLSKQQPEA